MYYTNFTEDTIKNNIEPTQDTITCDTDEYQQFVIYKCELNRNIYIGSSINFKKRLILHKHRIKNSFNGKIYKYFNENNIDFNENYFNIIFKSGRLIANTQSEIDYIDLIKRKKERDFQNYYNCVNNGLNDILAWTSAEEKEQNAAQYRLEHREHIKILQKQWYIKHRERRLQDSKIKITCECGSVVTKNHISSHKKTKKHMSYMLNHNLM